MSRNIGSAMINTLVVSEDEHAIANAVACVQSIANVYIMEEASAFGPFWLDEMGQYDAIIFHVQATSASFAPFCHQLKADGVSAPLLMLIEPGCESHIPQAYAAGAADVVILDRAGGYLYQLPVALQRLVTVKAGMEEKQALQAIVNKYGEQCELFAGMLAHDIKSPLAVVVTYAETLNSPHIQTAPEELARICHMISIYGRRVSDIVDELLLLATIQGDQVQKTVVDMEQVVKAVLSRFVELPAAANATIEVSENWPLSMGHAPWLEHVWHNFISNGLKYGGSPARLLLGAHLLEDGYTRYWINDNGPGIADSEIDSIFEPFSRVTSEEVKGHGLGLWIANRAIAKLGGRIGVECEPAGGSTFYFELPTASQSSELTYAGYQMPLQAAIGD